MIIKKLTASFGKLDNESISFHDGLNVINMPNESGKSTWCAFISAMLYGIDTSDRAKNGYIPDKQKYVPWSGALMEGTMDVTHKGDNITISRTTTSPVSPMREFSAKYTETNNDVPYLNASNTGETLTGVSKEVFERSAYFKQGSTKLTSSEELEKRILSLYSTGEESVSYTSSDEKLKAWKRKRRYNAKGLLPEIENELDYKNRTLEEIIKSSDEISIFEESERHTKEEIEDLEQLLIETKRQSRNSMFHKISEARDELDDKTKKQAESFEMLNDMKQALKESALGVKKEDEVLEESKRDIDAINTLKGLKKATPALILSSVFLLLAVVGAAIYEKVLNTLVISALTIAFAAAGIVLMLIYQNKKRKYIDSLAKAKQILSRYGAENAEEIEDIVTNHLDLCSSLYDAMEEYKLSCKACDAAREKLVKLENELILDEEDVNLTTLSDKLKELRGKLSMLSMNIASSKGKVITLGDPLVIRGEIDSLERSQEEIEKEYDAISLAIEVLKKSNEEIQNKFSPQIGKLSAEYMSQLTDGKYGDVMLNRDFSAMTKTAQDTVAHDSGYLSAGTSDLLYIAIKLAICEIVLPKEESCPIIIDDALVNLDNERYEKAISLLLQIAKKRQVIVFTCRK